MAQTRDTQNRTGWIALGALCALVCLPTLVRADAYGAAGVGPSEDIIDGPPPVTGFVNDGDETVVETVMLYMNGCPVVSITPPEGGRGTPTITSIEQTGACVAGRGTQDPEVLEARGESGMFVQLWTGPDADAEDPATLVIEVSSLYPAAPSETPGAPTPMFDIPGLFGDPSGDLTLAAGGGPGGGGTIWGGGGGGGGWPGGGGSGGGGGGDDPFPGGTFLNTTPGGGEPSVPPIAAVPLPATLLLLLWALQLLRSYVRRT